ncbi:MAG: c-type cytochrome, partial [Acidobacteria bacterium]|nr:c-type cytochrome [Acidobacteriota bacterium]
DQQATAQEDQRGEDEEGHPPRNAFMFPPTNLQVLQVEEAEDLRPIMRAFTAGLGVGCQHCHEEGNFAVDTELKELARNMIRMVEHLNADVFTWSNAPTATCFMCHKGHEKPELEPPPESDDTQTPE